MNIYSEYINYNKYAKWYLNIIEIAKNRISEESIYKEIHHIIPISFGGDNNENNLVALTYREHFLCHWLLVKCAKKEYKRKAQSSLNCMRRNKKQVVYKSSWRYEVMKTAARDSMKGRVVSELTKEKNRNIAKALHQDPDYIKRYNEGVLHGKKAAVTEKRKNASRNNILKYNGSEKHIAAVKKAQSGKSKSEDQKRKQSETMKNGAAAFGERNSMKNPDHVAKVRDSKIGIKKLKKEGYPNKMAKPNTEKWKSLISQGYKPIETYSTAQDMIG